MNTLHHSTRRRAFGRRAILLPSEPFSLSLLDGLQVRLRRLYMRETPAGFGLERLATTFMNHPG